VTEIANSANTTGVTAEQVTNFTVKIRILQESYQDLVNPTSAIAPFRPGMSATTDIQTKKVSNIVAVPIQAVTARSDTSSVPNKEMKKETKEESGDGLVVKDEKNKNTDTKEVVKAEEYVFILSEGKAKMVKVKTGIQDNDYIEIKEGIKEGDEIISAPYGAISKQLKNGTAVKKVEKSELFTAPKK
jgi:HlyD family secretion protein